MAKTKIQLFEDRLIQEGVTDLKILNLESFALIRLLVPFMKRLDFIKKHMIYMFHYIPELEIIKGTFLGVYLK